ncbi:hypothetical protein TNCV_2943641, partial [Trichonephila clavipes]
MSWCHHHRTWTIERHQVLFTDESRLCLWRHGGHRQKIPEGSELANKVANDAKIVAKVAKWTANLSSSHSIALIT